jgi:hypothetical protein
MRFAPLISTSRPPSTRTRCLHFTAGNFNIYRTAPFSTGRDEMRKPRSADPALVAKANAMADAKFQIASYLLNSQQHRFVVFEVPEPSLDVSYPLLADQFLEFHA